jgi:hypothetical protein
MDPTILSTGPVSGPGGEGLRIFALAVVVLVLAVVATFLLVVIFGTVNCAVGDGSSAAGPAEHFDPLPCDGPFPPATDDAPTRGGDYGR